MAYLAQLLTKKAWFLMLLVLTQNSSAVFTASTLDVL